MDMDMDMDAVRQRHRPRLIAARRDRALRDLLLATVWIAALASHGFAWRGTVTSPAARAPPKRRDDGFDGRSGRDQSKRTACWCCSRWR